MTSVADQLRRAQRERLFAMAASERIALAFQLGERDVELFCALQQVPPEVARRVLAGTRRTGRHASRVMERDVP